MWETRTVTVVFPAYNEAGNIRRAVDDFFGSGVVDEIIVVDNNSTDATGAETMLTRARLVRESNQGYGAALRRGLAEAKGDLIVLAEPDGTFAGKDVTTLLQESRDFEMVCGTRTNPAFIVAGARMGPSIRWGNVVVARLMSLLYATCRLTDCGCTLRLVRRDALDRFLGDLKVDSSHFLPEMIIAASLKGVTMVEVPVSYGPRVGESKITGTLRGAITTGARMVGLILSRRIQSLRVGATSGVSVSTQDLS
jgi:glycosyltransferase involved in cell wall biosynthesis